MKILRLTKFGQLSQTNPNTYLFRQLQLFVQVSVKNSVLLWEHLLQVKW